MTVCFSDIRIDRKKVRRMYLKIHRDGSVSMTVPAQAGQETVRLFFEEKKTWVEETLRHMPAQPHHTYVQGEKHFFMGRTVFWSASRAALRDAGSTGKERALRFLLKAVIRGDS